MNTARRSAWLSRVVTSPSQSASPYCAAIVGAGVSVTKLVAVGVAGGVDVSAAAVGSTETVAVVVMLGVGIG